MTLEELENLRLQTLQQTKKLEEEKINKFEQIIETSKQMQERRLQEQMQRLEQKKKEYRMRESPLNNYQSTSVISDNHLNIMNST
jgi:DNA repair protein RadC